MTLLVDTMQIVEGFPTVDLSSGANDGDWINLKDWKHIAIIFRSGIGTAGQDPTLTIEQATDVSGAGVKALNFTTIYRKQAATDLSAVGAFTKTTQTAANTYTDGDAAEEALIWIVEINADELDINNGFLCIRATIADVGAAAQPGDLLYILSEPRYAHSAENMPSALVD